MKSDCCRAEVKLSEFDAHYHRCTKCGEVCRLFEKLTPSQVKAIRWPTWEECDEQEGKQPTAHHFADWIIRYALQDLMPEEK